MPAIVRIQHSTPSDVQRLGIPGAHLATVVKHGYTIPESVVLTPKFLDLIAQHNRLPDRWHELNQLDLEDQSHYTQHATHKLRQAIADQHLPPELKHKLATALHAIFGSNPVTVRPSYIHDHQVASDHPVSTPVSGESAIIQQLLQTWADQHQDFATTRAHFAQPHPPMGMLIQRHYPTAISGASYSGKYHPEQRHRLQLDIHHPQGTHRAWYDTQQDSLHHDPILRLNPNQRQQLTRMGQAALQLKRNQLDHISVDWLLSDHDALITGVRPHQEVSAMQTEQAWKGIPLVSGTVRGPLSAQPQSGGILVTPVINHSTLAELENVRGFITSDHPSQLVIQTLKQLRIPTISVSEVTLRQLPVGRGNQHLVTLDANYGRISLNQPSSTHAKPSSYQVGALAGNPSTAELVGSQPADLLYFDTGYIAQRTAQQQQLAINDRLEAIHAEARPLLDYYVQADAKKIIYQSPRVADLDPEANQDGAGWWIAHPQALAAEIAFVYALNEQPGCDVEWVTPTIRSVSEWHLLRMLVQNAAPRPVALPIWLQVDAPIVVTELHRFLEQPPQGIVVDLAELHARYLSIPLGSQHEYAYNQDLLVDIMHDVHQQVTHHRYGGPVLALTDHYEHTEVQALSSICSGFICRPQHVGPIKQQLVQQ